jgi:general secretion pathway protein B
MSSILKALKKLEDDKATRQPDELKINAEILRGNDSPRYSSSGLLLTSLFFVTCGAGATYLYMKHDTNMISNTKATLQISADNKPEPLLLKTIPVTTSLVPHEPVKTSAKNPDLPQSRKPVPEVVPTSSTATTIRNKPVITPKRLQQEINATSAVSPQQPTVQNKAVPVLRVNGIAFQNSGTDNVAIINGTPVSSGTMVEGVKVEEILKDRVVFQRNGEKFEILLGQSNLLF